MTFIEANPLETPTPPSPEFNPASFRIYDISDIEATDGEYQLPILLNNTTFRLPMRQVGPPDHPVSIAWFDPNPQRNWALSYASGREMSKLLVAQQARLVISFGSSKSEPFIRMAGLHASQAAGMPVDVLFLPANKNINVLRAQARDAIIHAYYPVTSQVEPKYMAILPDQVRRIALALEKGQKIVWGDDVFTTGGTRNAGAHLINEQFGIESAFPTVVVARESFRDASYPQPLPPDVHAAIQLPEIPVGLEALGALVG